MAEKEFDRVLLAHGGGGIMMRELISMITGKLGTGAGGPLQDSAVIGIPGGRIAFTTDSFVVSPLFFPGGDIGDLAVNGTVNDLAVSGAVPRYISLSFIIEEGFPLADLGRILDSVAGAAREADVEVVTGDTKVVERGKADGLFITTTGIGIIPEGVSLSSDRARAGDRILVSGPIGEHGIAILSKREGIDFGGDLESDTAPLSKITVPLLERIDEIRCMRDATRGGLAAVLNEIATDSGVALRISEPALPISEKVRRGCDLMGYDPLHIANEGRFVAMIGPDTADAALELVRTLPHGGGAALVGEALAEPAGLVILETVVGGERVVDLPYGDLLPRIC